MKIHPTAVVSSEAEIAEGVEIGPYCVVLGRTKIGKGTILEANVTIGSRFGVVEVGENNTFSPGAVVGGPPQDLTYKNEPTRLKIGDNNTIREFCTLNIATNKADKETYIGNNNYLMAYVHLGHDCKIHNHVVIANNTNIAGHSVIEDRVTIGGVCAFNQFTHVGKLSFIAGASVVNKDILPFSKAQGNYAVCRATNKIGLQRNGFTPEEVENVHRAIRIILMGSDTIDEGIARIRTECVPSPPVDYFVNFIKSSKRGIAK